MFNLKTATSLLFVLLCATIFSGCIQSNQEIIVDEMGMAKINFSVIADKSQAGSEVSQLAWQMEQLIPELNTDYDRTNYTFEEGYTEYLVYEWKAKNEVHITDIKGVTWTEENGSYQFEVAFERVFGPDEVDESEQNDVVMELTLTMPRPISMANTPFVEDDTARWTVTKELLSQNTTLWAISS